MALLSSLVKTIAEAQGFEEAQVAGFARYLREKGYVSQAGRGRGAAHATALDAARILIAINATDKATAAALALERFAALKLRIPAHDTRHLKISPELAGVYEQGAPFDRVLAAFVEWSKPTPDGGSHLDNMLANVENDTAIHQAQKYGYEVPSPILNVTIERPSMRASIAFCAPDLWDDPGGVPDWGYPPSLTLSFYPDPDAHTSTGEPDRRITAVFTQRTLFTVAETLAT